MPVENKKPKPRGFAAMSAEQRKAIASSGGKKAQAGGKANRFNSETGLRAVGMRKDRKDESI